MTKTTRSRPGHKKLAKPRRRRKSPDAFVMDDAADPVPDFGAVLKDRKGER